MSEPEAREGRRAQMADDRVPLIAVISIAAVLIIGHTVRTYVGLTAVAIVGFSGGILLSILVVAHRERQRPTEPDE